MLKLKSGIYLIQNTVNRKRYIGSSRRLNHRKNCHLSELRKGIHKNKQLQKEFSEYGEDVFSWTILEFSDPNNLSFREQFWLDTLNPEYNVLRTADNHSYSQTELTRIAAKRRGEKMRGRKQTKEEKEKRSRSLLAHYADPANREKLRKTPEQREHFRWLSTGERNPNYGKPRSEETRKKISEGNSKTYVFISPDGQEVIVKNLLRNGERITGLPYWNLRQLYRGLKKEIDGWTFRPR